MASIYDIYYKMVETRILKDKKNRRIIKMDRNKVNNNKYAYIVDTEREQEPGEWRTCHSFYDRVDIHFN